MLLRRIFLPHLSLCALFSALPPASAGENTLYLLKGAPIHGEITDRSADIVTVSTVQGLVKIRTSDLMPITRQQLKLPAATEETMVAVQPTPTPKLSEREALLQQIETLLAENQELKRQLTAFKKSGATEITSPAEGPPDHK